MAAILTLAVGIALPLIVVGSAGAKYLAVAVASLVLVLAAFWVIAYILHRRVTRRWVFPYASFLAAGMAGALLLLASPVHIWLSLGAGVVSCILLGLSVRLFARAIRGPLQTAPSWARPLAEVEARLRYAVNSMPSALQAQPAPGLTPPPKLVEAAVSKPETPAALRPVGLERPPRSSKVAAG